MNDQCNGPEKQPLPAYSQVERHFYLMVRRCGRCNSGPFEFVGSEARQEGQWQVDDWEIRCRACKQQEHVLFDQAALLVDPAADDKSLLVVNPGREPSRLLDLTQWMALFVRIMQAASSQTDRVESRRLGYEGALCLDEALKFYEPDNDLPPAEAFFSEQTLNSFREHPEHFSRQRLMQMQEKLPPLHRMRSALGQHNTGEKRGRWQRFKDRFGRADK